MDYWKGLVTPSTFTPPNKNRICGVHNNLCYDKTKKRIEVNPKWYNVLFTALTIIGLTILGMWVLETYFGYGKLVIGRFFSVSFLSGVIGFLALLYDIRIFKAIFLSISPIIIFYVPILYFIDHQYDLVYFHVLGIINWEMALITHIPHFLITLALWIEKSDFHHYDFIFAGIFWMVELTFAYYVFPDFKMFYTLNLFPTLVIFGMGCFISWGISFFLYKKRRFYTFSNK